MATTRSTQAGSGARDPVTHEQSLTSVIVRHPDLVTPFRLLFEAEWENAQPFDEQAAEAEGARTQT